MSRKAHIVGVGESQYTKWGKIGDITEHALALQAIMTAVPHQVLRFTGEVLRKTAVGNEYEIEVSLQAANDSDNHLTGTAVITLPLAS